MANATEIAVSEAKLNERGRILHWLKKEAENAKDLAELKATIDKIYDETMTLQRP